jgi:hypothetical protein
MTDDIKREIERLLDEPNGLAATGHARGRVRSRLAATLTEGVGDASLASPKRDAGTASVAAFLDGQLTGAARDKFVVDLAQPHLRADVEAGAALVDSIADSPLKVPKHLLARASTQFTTAPKPVLRTQWDLSALMSLWPRQRLVWAAVAAFVVIVVAVPAGLMITGQSGGGPQPELSSVPEPSEDASQKQKACEEKLKVEKQKAKKENSALPGISPSSSSKDPCDRFTPEHNGGGNK